MICRKRHGFEFLFSFTDFLHTFIRNYVLRVSPWNFRDLSGRQSLKIY